MDDATVYLAADRLGNTCAEMICRALCTSAHAPDCAECKEDSTLAAYAGIVAQWLEITDGSSSKGPTASIRQDKLAHFLFATFHTAFQVHRHAFQLPTMATCVENLVRCLVHLPRHDIVFGISRLATIGFVRQPDGRVYARSGFIVKHWFTSASRDVSAADLPPPEVVFSVHRVFLEAGVPPMTMWKRDRKNKGKGEGKGDGRNLFMTVLDGLDWGAYAADRVAHEDGLRASLLSVAHHGGRAGRAKM